MMSNEGCRLIHNAVVVACCTVLALAFENWLLIFLQRSCYAQEVGVWKSGDVEIYFYRNEPMRTYASFYKDSKDTYVLLGGYGHHMNPYTHFMHRGYGDEFESKMAAEAYQWLCRDILRVVADSIFDTWEEANPWLVKKRDEFNYKIEW